ncbi:MAG TPA: NADH:flavin oxidoreductase [Gemmataceae bacterium]|nr:NADH:flavin oxidoreductase [Gemmataceae bacterium]
MSEYRRVASLKTAEDFLEHTGSLGISFPFDATLDAGPSAPLAQPFSYGGRTIGNRFCILPMEGWDSTPDGRPSELTIRRWRRFGASGAKLIWGGEAVSVRHDGRDSPNEMVINEETLPSLAALREILLAEHRKQFGRTDDLLIGLQLTHSGRFSKPNEKFRPEPLLVYRHPLLDRKFGIKPDQPVLTDDEIARLVDDFIRSAKQARQAGFDFVDIKHCHGYLGHEFLSAVDRAGKYGGSFEKRTRFLREIVEGIRAEVPDLDMGVRISAFDFIPFHPGADGHGEPESFGESRYPYAFGGDGSGTGIDLMEPLKFLDLLNTLGIRLVCMSAGSPYYNPHILRPALFPPSDGYLPPEDPLVGVARHIAVAAELKRAQPEMIVVGSGYSYLQEWLPHVGQAAIRARMVDFVGIGRMALTYPDLPADVLAGRPLQRKRICRTFSDCTTGPRNGLISGCFPLDPFYHQLPEREQLVQIKQRQ